MNLREKVRRAPKWLKNKLRPGGLILMYHRVAELPLDPHSLSVTPQHFAEHLEVLRKYSRPTSLRQLTGMLRNGERPRRHVVVTFDDGYTDNLYNAKPLLERYEIPATVFVTTGRINNEQEFMWDELERLLLLPGRLPEVLSIKMNGSVQDWRLGQAVHYSDDDYRRHRGWTVSQADDPSPRHTLYRSLHPMLKPLPEPEQLKVLEQLRALAGVEAKGRTTHRTMTSEEVLNLASGGLVEVGSHTVTHPVLSEIPADAQRVEIQQSKSHLEEILGEPVKSFAYPFGAHTEETARLVEEAGYDCACSTLPDIVWSGSLCYQLPRVDVGDWDGDRFAGYIRRLALG